eukprot:8637222-Pyramimonas_sp.AAC.3
MSDDAVTETLPLAVEGDDEQPESHVQVVETLEPAQASATVSDSPSQMPTDNALKSQPETSVPLSEPSATDEGGMKAKLAGWTTEARGTDGGDQKETGESKDESAKATRMSLKETSEAIRHSAVVSMEKTREGLAAAGLKLKQSSTVCTRNTLGTKRVDITHWVGGGLSETSSKIASALPDRQQMQVRIKHVPLFMGTEL